MYFDHTHPHHPLFSPSFLLLVPPPHNPILLEFLTLSCNGLSKGRGVGRVLNQKLLNKEAHFIFACLREVMESVTGES
jgi:hypothetical protein